MIEKQAWFRREDEPMKAYLAFQWYIFLPPESRSVDAAYNASQQHQEGTKKAPGSWKNYSLKYDWVERANLYDDHLNARQFFLQEDASREYAEARARRAEFLERKENEVAEKLFKLAEEMLAHPLKKAVAKDDKGNVFEIHPVKWTLASLPRVVEAASKLGRLSAGMPTDVRQLDFVGTMNAITDSLLDIVKREAGSEAYARVVAAIEATREPS